MRFLCVLIGFLSLSFAFPAPSFARARYTKSQVRQIIAKAKGKKVREALKKDKILKKLRKLREQISLRHHIGSCKSISLPWMRKHCSRRCILTRPTYRNKRICAVWGLNWKCKRYARGRCVRKVRNGRHCKRYRNIRTISGKRCVRYGNICKPVKTKKHIELCVRRFNGHPTVYVNGRRDKVLPALRSSAIQLKKSFAEFEAKLKEKSKKLGKKIKARIKEVKKQSKALFEKALAAYKKKARELALRLAKSKTIRQNLSSKILATAGSSVLKAAKLARSKLRTKLLSALRNERNYKQIKGEMLAKQSAANSLKSYGKTAAIAVGLVVAAKAAKITAVCWPYSGSSKRRCLRREISNAMRDGLFDVVGALVQTALDLEVIEPVSHILASLVSIKLASISAGVGAAGYPIVYLASSFALNGVIGVTYEVAFRPQYNKLYNRHVHRSVSQLSARIIANLRDSDLKCWGPQYICK